ncbi:Moybdenum cofactor oxidoreductase, dimerization [Dillenia turbinata]|uniref:Moybdenum cofactor oxidoreductase, dimerization n=1 Tax=Dillenia turbinata TaxID=194707 RepID=A0AAN8UFE7_9MAGN
MENRRFLLPRTLESCAGNRCTALSKIKTVEGVAWTLQLSAMEEHEGSYNASIPLYHASNPEADVLFAYEMNGECAICSLEDVNVINNGMVGILLDAVQILNFITKRNLCIIVSSEFYWCLLVYTGAASDIFICLEIFFISPILLFHLCSVVSGYAVLGGGRGIERIGISADSGKTWIEASRYQKAGTQYDADDIDSGKWAWVLFETHTDVSQGVQR